MQQMQRVALLKMYHVMDQIEQHMSELQSSLRSSGAPPYSYDEPFKRDRVFLPIWIMPRKIQVLWVPKPSAGLHRLNLRLPVWTLRQTCHAFQRSLSSLGTWMHTSWTDLHQLQLCCTQRRDSWSQLFWSLSVGKSRKARINHDTNTRNWNVADQ